ncbi:MAG TPA: amidohydrolase family protein, partial [Polyangiaceae bacterium LLY-WYZ-15_(1-7)]|nr:amidohydrolase family protein [Polyangiaceae bacterium LLY-WYZ-15_(1-7)]
MLDLVLKGAHLATCDGAGSAAEQLDRRPDAAVGVEGGRVVWIGPSAEAPAAREVRELEGAALLPGLVDPHTHLVFAGSRVEEFTRRMGGEDYRTIAAEGGGIASTVRATRAASEEQLFALAKARAEALRARGVTSVEVKSGYGLTTESELRLLRVARRLEAEGVLRVTTSFLGAHAVPPEKRGERARYVDEVVGEQLPAVAEAGLADAVDVYCDDGAFTLEETRRILEAAKARGLKVRAHVGQFADLGGPALLAELGGL